MMSEKMQFLSKNAMVEMKNKMRGEKMGQNESSGLVMSCLNTCSEPGFPCSSLFDILDAMRDFCRGLRLDRSEIQQLKRGEKDVY